MAESARRSPRLSRNQSPRQNQNSPRQRGLQSSSLEPKSSNQNRSSQPISSGKVSSSVKRSSTSLLRSTITKRLRIDVSLTPSETMTPRSTIRAFLKAADSRTPEKEQLDQSSPPKSRKLMISNKQVEKVIEKVTRRRSPRNSIGLTHGECLTPREAMRRYLSVAEKVSGSEQNEPERGFGEETLDFKETKESMQQSMVQSGEDKKSLETNDRSSHILNTKIENKTSPGGNVKVENVQPEDEIGDEHGDRNTETEDEIGDTHGDRNTETEDETDGEHGDRNTETEDETDGEHGEKYIETQNEITNNLEYVNGNLEDVPIDSQLPSDSCSSQNEKIPFKDHQREESSHVDLSQRRGSYNVNRSGNSKLLDFSKLETPILCNVSIEKATPVVLRKPHVIPSQREKTEPSRKLTKAKSTGKESRKKRQTSTVPKLPSTLTSGIFRHFSALRVSKDALDSVQNASDAFFKQLSTDLKTYSAHAGRKTIDESDVELLMRRQNLVTSRESFNGLIEKYLPMEYRQEILPCAKSGNKIIPKMKR
ncbi:centromere protein T-like [Xenia sp. Carnegie-2017]|uniref:centromere protein T-like n=1 Tax=Xenia sp. Carnegie-2017 TaxID=2897299 RepID=UPI001F043EC4|nr:centromere protein T-like [Xenia sp. Carnegie-2017]